MREETIIAKIRDLNTRADIHGILVQLPLPHGYDEDRVVAAIDPAKDVDGFHPENLARIKEKKPIVIPGVAMGIVRLIEETKITLAGSRALLAVNSEIFALPLRYLLEERGARVETIVAPRSAEDIKASARTADVIVLAVGQPQFLRGEMVKGGAVVIDVGTNRMDGKLVGDADFESFLDRDVWITPVPGGVGPMTVAMLLRNVVEASSRRGST